MEYEHYDAIVAGGRVAGAATAMLLARKGLRVLIVDPMRRGSDTLSTHALMRGAVLQLHRWSLLDAIRNAGTPAIRTTTFHYADESIAVPIKERDGIEGLFAPRRTVLDAVLLNAAEEAGAELALGSSVVGLTRDGNGRVIGARIADRGGTATTVGASVVIGADGVHSRIAREVGARTEVVASHCTASIYGYRKGIELDGYHWIYQVGASAGAIPTNDGATNVFVTVPATRFEREPGRGLEALYEATLREVSPDLAEQVAASEGVGRLRGFAGVPGFFRQSAGPGWALVGDAGYFKDPLTAHGITDALRDAELLARAVATGNDLALAGYEAARNQIGRPLFDVTDRIASFEWDLEEVKALHLTLSKEMNREIEVIHEFDAAPALIG